MNAFDGMMMYMLLLLIGFIVSYFYGVAMFNQTRSYNANTIMALVTNFAFAIMATLGWLTLTFQKNAMLFFSGIAVGFIMWTVSEVILLVLLIGKRKQIAQQ